MDSRNIHTFGFFAFTEFGVILIDQHHKKAAASNLKFRARLKKSWRHVNLLRNLNVLCGHIGRI